MTNPDPAPQPQHFKPKSRVIGQFVDEIPDIPTRKTNLTRFESHPETFTTLQRAFEAPGRAMLFCEYNFKPPSRSRTLAQARAAALIRDGYSNVNGWVVRAVENQVYVIYQGVG